MKQPTNYLPSNELRRYISGYGILEIPYGASEPYFSPPLGLSGFIIQVICPPNVLLSMIEGKVFFSEKAVATGQVTAPIYGQMLGALKTIMVFFQPLGMYQLFGRDMATLTNTSMTLENFLGKTPANTLMNKLQANQNSASQITVLNDFFMGIKPLTHTTDKLNKVIDYIHAKNGSVTIKEIENYGHYQKKTLERHFKKMIGLTPKVYAKIYQFKSLVNLLQENPQMSWIQLAQQAGYYDQSHMSRYVKEYLKVSPNTMVQLDMDFINYLLRK